MSVPVIAFFNNKGGVGKTSLVYHLSWMFADRGTRVIAADLDPQGNASSGVGYPRDTVDLTIYDALVGECTIAEVIRPTDIPTLFVARATVSAR